MPNKLAISLYLYHPDLFPLFFNMLKNIKIKHTLYLGLCEDQNYDKFIKDEKFLHNYYLNGDIKIFWYPNAGADNLCFMHHINLMSEEYFIKIHSKKSRQGLQNEVDWLAMFLDSLIFSNKTIETNIKNFDNQEKLGIITNKLCYVSNFEHLNTYKIQELCKILDMDYLKVRNGTSVSGTMFMSRTKLFQQYFTMPRVDTIMNKLMLEKGSQKDKDKGTYTHSLERLYGYIIADSGMYFSDSDTEKIQLIEKNNEKKTLRIMFNNDCYISMNNNLYSFYEALGNAYIFYYGTMKQLQDKIQILWKKNKLKRIKYYQLDKTNACLREI